MDTAQNVEDDVIQTDDDIIVRNQGIRRRFVNELTADGKFPEDTKGQYVLLTVMSDMDRTALANKKIGSTERQSQADRQAQLLIARLSNQFGSVAPFERTGDTGRQGAPVLDVARLPGKLPVPGEMEQGLPTDNFETFMERMDEQAASANQGRP